MVLVTVTLRVGGTGGILKRFAAIVTIAVVVLAMTAGPAMASVCAGSQCGEAMVCDQAYTPQCPMQNGAVMSHGDCGHSADRSAAATVSNQAGPDFGLVGAPLPGALVPPTAALGMSAFALADARGAPHLTSVIRI